MSNNNYSYALSIKVWSDLTNSNTNYGNIETIVKQMFIQKNEEPFLWEQKLWTKYDKLFNGGDLVINSYFDSDAPIFEYVMSTIDKITDELRSSGKLSNREKIIFNIVKPLALTSSNILKEEQINL